MNDFESSLVSALRAEVEQVVGSVDDTRAVQRLESRLDRVDHDRRRRIWVTMAAVGAAAAVISVIALADRATDHALPLPPIGPSPSTSAVTSPAPAGAWGTGPVGTTFTFTSADGARYGVTLTKVTVDAKGADATTTPDPGNRFVQAEFTIKGVTGTSTRDANKMAELVSDDRHRYQPDLSLTKGCTNFESGNFTVVEGAQATGCVTFQLFADLRLAEIGWTDLSSSDPPATWVIGTQTVPATN